MVTSPVNPKAVDWYKFGNMTLEPEDIERLKILELGVEMPQVISGNGNRGDR